MFLNLSLLLGEHLDDLCQLVAGFGLLVGLYLIDGGVVVSGFVL